MIIDYIDIVSILQKIPLIILIIILTLILVKVIKAIMHKMKSFSSMDATLVYLINDLITYIVYIIGLLLVFDVFGIDLTSIFVSIGIVGVTVGFAAKDIISNFVSGIFIISDKNIKIGDTIETDSIKGKVKKITFRSTTIRDSDGVISVIPNSVLSNKPYNKYKFLEYVRVDLIATIPLDINIEVFENKIINTMNDIKELNKNKSPKIFVQKITEEGVIIKTSIWIDDYYKLDSVKLKIANKIRILILEEK